MADAIPGARFVEIHDLKGVPTPVEVVRINEPSAIEQPADFAVSTDRRDRLTLRMVRLIPTTIRAMLRAMGQRESSQVVPAPSPGSSGARRGRRLSVFEGWVEIEPSGFEPAAFRTERVTFTASGSTNRSQTLGLTAQAVAG